MKDKIYNYVGEIVFLTIKFGLVVAIFIGISIIVFEDQKEDMFFQVMRYFNAAYDAKVDELHTNLGVVDKDDVDQDNQFLITNIGFTKQVQEKKIPKLITNVSIICAEKIFPDPPDIVTESMMDEMNQCVDQQVKDAIVIGQVYMDEVTALPKGPTKTILQAIVVECNKNNTIEEQGGTDYTSTLQCIKSDMKKLNEMLDLELDKIKTQKGI